MSVKKIKKTLLRKKITPIRQNLVTPITKFFNFLSFTSLVLVEIVNATFCVLNPKQKKSYRFSKFAKIKVANFIFFYVVLNPSLSRQHCVLMNFTSKRKK